MNIAKEKDELLHCHKGAQCVLKCPITALTHFCFFQDNINVDEAAHFLVENILANDKGLPYEESNGDRIKLEQQTVAAESKPGCC